MQNLILNAYAELNRTTPLNIDCGLICDHRCCQGEDAGMWLLPGEEELLRGEEGYRFVRDEDATLLICQGTCQRALRSFACRVFPLFPLVTAKETGGYNIRLIYDPRAYHLCPLAASNYPLRGIFRYLVRKTTRELLADPILCQWFLEQSDFISALEDIRYHLQS